MTSRKDSENIDNKTTFKKDKLTASLPSLEHQKKPDKNESETDILKKQQEQEQQQ